MNGKLEGRQGQKSYPVEMPEIAYGSLVACEDDFETDLQTGQRDI
jgi:hypothetical protein